ncbi:amidohydrolase [Candidatus Poribacteria bacterium]|nr:MAG: amidohydrolase [Candidatus Poribacteria bacterium]
MKGKLFYNARFYTLSDPPLAEAMAVCGGRVLAVGALDELKGIAGRGWERIDLGGRVALPGLHDAHLHLLGYGLSLERVDLSGAGSLEECLRLVAERGKTVPPGRWVLGRGWNYNAWAEGRLPTRWDLDRVLPDRPALLSSKDGHLVWANSLAIKLAGIPEDAPDPEGGHIVRDERGRMTGVFQERAAEPLWRAVPEPDLEERVRALLRAQGKLLEMGITCVHTMEGRECFEALQELRRRGELKLRVVIYLPQSSIDHLAALGLRSGFGDDLLRIGGVKLFADGALGGQTAALFEPYIGMGDYRGILVQEPEELEEAVRRAAEAGLSVAVHAIGDRAVSVALDAIELASSRIEANHLRPRIEHVQLIRPEDMERMARLKVIASMQPSHAVSDRPVAERYWGERCRWAYAWRSLLEAGVVLAFGSDAPVEPPDPFFGLYAAVTRRDERGEPPGGWHPEQRLTVEEAIRAYTCWAAMAGGTATGGLEPGRWADFALLPDDPFTAPPERLKEIKPEAVYIAGERVWPEP